MTKFVSLQVTTETLTLTHAEAFSCVFRGCVEINEGEEGLLYVL